MEFLPSPARLRGSFKLRSDLRLDSFAVLFAFGTILHELEFAVEQALVGPFGEYMERWSRVLPSTGWPSEVGVALHLANVAISLLLLIAPRRRELLCALAVTFLLSQLASPNRIASHSGLMAGALLVIVLLGLAEWVQCLASSGDSPRLVWYHWTLTGLAWICALTYFFAFLYKLNPVWFSPDSHAPGFLVEPVAPLLDRAGAPPAYRSALARLAIYGTLVVELMLPVLLFVRCTRLVACFVGLAFHLPMIAQGVSDFPVLIVAFYPAFLSRAQTRELLRRLARPSIARLAAVAVLGGVGIWVIQRAPKLIWQYQNALDLDPLVRIANTGGACVAFVGVTYATLTIGTWVLERRSRVAREHADRLGGDHLHDSPAVVAHRVSSDARVAAAAVLLVALAFVYNNVARFFGFPGVGAISMFSGIAIDRGNHFFLPRVALHGSYAYVGIARFDPEGIDTPRVRDFHAFLQSLDEQTPPSRVNLNFVRYHMNRICASAPGRAIRLDLETPKGDILHFANVCVEPSMLRYGMLPVATPCDPQCDAVVRRWARGQLSR